MGVSPVGRAKTVRIMGPPPMQLAGKMDNQLTYNMTFYT